MSALDTSSFASAGNEGGRAVLTEWRRLQDDAGLPAAAANAEATRSKTNLVTARSQPRPTPSHLGPPAASVAGADRKPAYTAGTAHTASSAESPAAATMDEAESNATAPATANTAYSALASANASAEASDAVTDDTELVTDDSELVTDEAVRLLLRQSRRRSVSDKTGQRLQAEQQAPRAPTGAADAPRHNTTIKTFEVKTFARPADRGSERNRLAMPAAAAAAAAAAVDLAGAPVIDPPRKGADLRGRAGMSLRSNPHNGNQLNATGLPHSAVRPGLAVQSSNTGRGAGSPGNANVGHAAGKDRLPAPNPVVLTQWQRAASQAQSTMADVTTQARHAAADAATHAPATTRGAPQNNRQSSALDVRVSTGCEQPERRAPMPNPTGLKNAPPKSANAAVHNAELHAVSVASRSVKGALLPSHGAQDASSVAAPATGPARRRTRGAAAKTIALRNTLGYVLPLVFDGRSYAVVALIGRRAVPLRVSTVHRKVQVSCSDAQRLALDVSKHEVLGPAHGKHSTLVCSTIGLCGVSLDPRDAAATAAAWPRADRHFHGHGEPGGSRRHVGESRGTRNGDVARTLDTATLAHRAARSGRADSLEARRGKHEHYAGRGAGGDDDQDDEEYDEVIAADQPAVQRLIPNDPRLSADTVRGRHAVSIVQRRVITVAQLDCYIPNALAEAAPSDACQGDVSRMGLLGGLAPRTLMFHLRLDRPDFALWLRHDRPARLCLGSAAAPPLKRARAAQMWQAGRKGYLVLGIDAIRCGNVGLRAGGLVGEPREGQSGKARRKPVALPPAASRAIVNMALPGMALPASAFIMIVDEINRRTGLFRSPASREAASRVRARLDSFPDIVIHLTPCGSPAARQQRRRRKPRHGAGDTRPRPGRDDDQGQADKVAHANGQSERPNDDANSNDHVGDGHDSDSDSGGSSGSNSQDEGGEGTHGEEDETVERKRVVLRIRPADYLVFGCDVDAKAARQSVSLTTRTLPPLPRGTLLRREPGANDDHLRQEARHGARSDRQASALPAAHETTDGHAEDAPSSDDDYADERLDDGCDLEDDDYYDQDNEDGIDEDEYDDDDDDGDDENNRPHRGRRVPNDEGDDGRGRGSDSDTPEYGDDAEAGMDARARLRLGQLRKWRRRRRWLLDQPANDRTVRLGLVCLHDHEPFAMLGNCAFRRWRVSFAVDQGRAWFW
jgi:hypothetical protein